MVEQLGGVFLDWSKRLAVAPGNPTQRNAWETMSAKGFRVFANGCILPHPYYLRKGSDGPSRVRGPRASIDMFRTKPAPSTVVVAAAETATTEATAAVSSSSSSLADSKKDGNTTATATNEAGTDANRNSLGWPTQPEVSHLCHWGGCVNPDHLRWEPRWQNWKRNYCRGCDCNASKDPADRCLSVFHPSTWWENESNWPHQLTYDSKSLTIPSGSSAADGERRVKWKDILPEGVTLLNSNHFTNEDMQSTNRMKRKRRGRKDAIRSVSKKRRQLLKMEHDGGEENEKKKRSRK